MSRAQNSSGRLRRAPLAIGLAALLAATACGAGQITQTDSQLPAVNGANVGVGPIAIRDVQFAYPHEGHYAQGGDAVLFGTVVNTGTGADTLVEVSSPLAEEVVVTGDTALPAGVALAIGEPGAEFHAEESAAATTTTTTTTAPTTTTEGEEGASTTTAPATTTATTTAAPTTTAAITLGKLTITLKGLSGDIYPGTVHPVTFVFANAGSVTVQLPIASPSEPRVAEEGSGGGGH
ncbi:hypothetical protein ACFPM7_07435 [Actinokineospora guangxiensis]|uniref:Copper(I)-binding protein n=1 Tax=Actinokineospora guangxiensis TaxID=1490288 RepID=A0ABW0EMW3_9PSEU